MGQQQLLLLVLGIVIVGFAVIVGIQAFAENQKKSNADGLALTAMRIASDAQAWLRTPASFGGGMPVTGVRPANFGGLILDLGDLGYQVDASGDYFDLYGAYSGSVESAGDFVIIATSAITSGAGDNNLVCVYVAGPMIDDITTTINPTSGNC